MEEKIERDGFLPPPRKRIGTGMVRCHSFSQRPETPPKSNCEFLVRQSPRPCVATFFGCPPARPIGTHQNRAKTIRFGTIAKVGVIRQSTASQRANSGRAAARLRSLTLQKSNNAKIGPRSRRFPVAGPVRPKPAPSRRNFSRFWPLGSEMRGVSRHRAPSRLPVASH